MAMSSSESLFAEEGNIVLIACICQGINIDSIQDGCTKRNIILNIQRPSQERKCIQDQLSDCVCGIIVLCPHYLDKVTRELTGCIQHTGLILVGNDKELPGECSNGIASVSLNEPDFISILIDMILTKLDYDDTLNPSNASDQNITSKFDQNENITKTTHVVRNSSINTEETNMYTKYNVNQKFGDQSPYETLPLEPRTDLINLKTGNSGSDVLVGVNVVEEYLHPSRSYWRKETSEIVEDINSGQRAMVSELTKYVYTNTIPSAKAHRELQTLSKLSECHGHGIEDRIAKEIQDLLFTTDVDSYTLDVLFESLEIFLTVVKRKAVSSQTSRNVLPIVILMLTLVFYVVLDKETNEKELARKLSKLSDLLDNTIYAPKQDIERFLLNATKMMIKGIKKIAKYQKSSCLQSLGCWRDEMMNADTVSNMASLAAKMSLTEQYALITRILIQIHLSMDISERLVDLMHTLMRSIAKKSESPQVFPLLVIVCRGITNLLDRHVRQDQQTPSVQMRTNNMLCEILNTCVWKIKHSRDIQKALQDELAILLFHRSSHIAKTVHGSVPEFAKVCLADKIPTYLQIILGPLGLTLQMETSVDYTKTLPRWQELKGYIAGRKEVNINVLLPDNNAFDMETYLRGAKRDPSNARHYNTLEMLKVLLGKDRHPNIRRLIAFQFQPIPVFYMTERLPDATLSTFLLSKRKQHDWQSLKTLGSIAFACADVAQYLHKRKIVHRNLIADSFKRRDHDTFVLSDFSIACLVDDDSIGSGTFVQDIEGKFIPTRWSAPESLLNDRYDAKSDTWMVGLLLYEIFTHGAHPYRDIYGTKLDDIMENVVFNNLSPRWYQCIPCPVHAIIAGCVKTKTEERLELSQVLKELKEWLMSLQEHQVKLPNLNHETFSKKNSEYPELDHLQGEPERGPTEQLKQLKKMNQDPRVSYYNNVELRRLSRYPDRIQIKEEHLKAADHPTIEKKGGFLEIQEPVSKAFITDTFPKMTSKPDFMTALTITNKPEKHARSSTSPDGLTYTLIYKCQNADSLQEITQIRMFGDPEDDENALLYLQVVKSLVQFVNLMHERHWILRDICCSTTFRAVEDGRVFMPRLGRMIKDQRRISRIEACVIDKNTCIDDRRNWMPAEVMTGGQFSQASDVYMIAMTIYEFYSTANLGKDNPMYNRLASVPFAKVEPEKLLETLNRGTVPERPASCPQWLYDLMLKCWDRDSTKRLTSFELLSEISERLKSTVESTNIDEHDNSGNIDSSVPLQRDIHTTGNQEPAPSELENNIHNGYSLASLPSPALDKGNSEKRGKLQFPRQSSKMSPKFESWPHTNIEGDGLVNKKSKSIKLKTNDYKDFPVADVRPKPENDYQKISEVTTRPKQMRSRLDTMPVWTETDPVYRDSASIPSNTSASKASVQSYEYQKSLHLRRESSRTDDEAPADVIPNSINIHDKNPIETDDADMYLTCVYAAEENENESKYRVKRNSSKEVLERRSAPSVSSRNVPTVFRSRLSGEIHPYDNASLYRKRPESAPSAERNLISTKKPLSIFANRQVPSRVDSTCSCKSVPGEIDGTCLCEKRSSKSDSVVSCGNSSCGIEGGCSCGNSSCGIEGGCSCGNSSCGSESVCSCGNSSCGSESVCSCGNSSCGNSKCERK